MTGLVRQVRALLDRSGAGKRLLLGCRVPSTIDECHVMGLDLPTWVGDRLVDHVAAVPRVPSVARRHARGKPERAPGTRPRTAAP